MEPLRPRPTRRAPSSAPQTADIALPPERDRLTLSGGLERQRRRLDPAEKAGTTATATCAAAGRIRGAQRRRRRRYPGLHAAADRRRRARPSRPTGPGVRLHGFQFTAAER